jgi:hypothetical protein
MTTDSELTRSLRAFLEEGADRMPERVYQAAMDVVPTTSRRRSWRSPLERRPVAMLLRVAAVVALVVGLGGISLLPNLGGVGTTPTPTPTATPTPSAPTPTPMPSGGPVAGLETDTVLGAGRYEVNAPFGFPFTIALPAESLFREIGPGTVTFETPNGSVEAFVAEAVFPDPCHITGAPVAIDTPDELVAALTSMTGFTATQPTATTVAGRPARTFVLTNTIDTATAGCTRDLMLPLFTYPGHPEGAGTNGGQRQVVWVVDVDGKPLLVLGDGWPDIARSDLEALIGTIELP